jgi:hypothetical protein
MGLNVNACPFTLAASTRGCLDRSLDVYARVILLSEQYSRYFVPYVCSSVEPTLGHQAGHLSGCDMWKDPASCIYICTHIDLMTYRQSFSIKSFNSIAGMNYFAQTSVLSYTIPIWLMGA